MNLSFLLLHQILKQFMMFLMGFAVVKTKLLNPSASRTLSVVTLYLVVPCAVVRAFQIDRNAETVQGLLLSLGISLLAVSVMFFLAGIAAKTFHLTAVEKASVLYSNSGNMVLPVITALLGTEWSAYSCVLMSLHTILFWTHLRTLVSGQKHIEWKKALSNINLIALAIGIFLYLFGLRLPALIEDTLASVGNMFAPLSMIVMGMLFATLRFNQIIHIKKAYLVAFLRLLFIPLCVLAVLAPVYRLVAYPLKHQIFMIVYLGVITPCASSIMQMAQTYSSDPEDGSYASALNVLTFLLCIVTMPLLIGLFDRVMH